MDKLIRLEIAGAACWMFAFAAWMYCSSRLSALYVEYTANVGDSQTSAFIATLIGAHTCRMWAILAIAILSGSIFIAAGRLKAE